MIVVGATWVIMYNADLILELLNFVAGRVRALAPVFKLRSPTRCEAFSAPASRLRCSRSSSSRSSRGRRSPARS